VHVLHPAPLGALPLLKKQEEKAEAEMCAWVEEAHRECQERDREEAERRARKAAQKAEKKKKKRSQKDQKKAKKAKRRGTKDKSLPKPSSPPPARS